MPRPRIECPYCGRSNNTSKPIDAAAVPKPGDVSICFYCGRPSIFQGSNKKRAVLRKPTLAEWVALRTNPAVWKARRVAKAVRNA